MNAVTFGLFAGRLLDMFGDVVMGVHHSHFEEALDELKEKRGVITDNELSADDLKELVASYKEVSRVSVKEVHLLPV